MIKSRNVTSHTYNEDTARRVAQAILDVYFAEFGTLRSAMETLRRNEAA